jgi:hypothetical protein
VYHFAAMNGPATGPARLRAWERDIINRQRNIVFPDTVLNEGRFYRNIASGKAVFSLGQKIGLICILAFFVLINGADFAPTVDRFLHAKYHLQPDPWIIWPSLQILLWTLFWAFLTIKALFPPQQPKRRRRGGYRSTKSDRER